MNRKNLVSSHHYVTMVLLLIILIGAGLRIYGLETQSLWNDEIATWSMSNFDSLWLVINNGVRPDVHPPGYQIIIYFVERYLGHSEMLLRLPSAISGILSIPVMFLVGKSIYTYREGLMAALFLAVLWVPIYYSQEARAYSTLLLFALLTSYFWVIIVRQLYQNLKPSIIPVMGYVVSAIMCSYLHYFGVYWVAWQGLAAFLILVRSRRNLGYIIGVYMLVGLAYLPWVPIMLEQMTGGSRHILPPEGNGFSTAIYFHRFLFNWSPLLQAIVIGLYLYLLFYNLYLRRKSNKGDIPRIAGWSSDLLLLMWLIMPFLVAYLISVFVNPVLLLRNLIISLPAAYLLLARAITRLPVPAAGQVIVTLAITGLFLVHLFFSLDYYTRLTKEQAREAAYFVAEHDPQYQDSLIISYPGPERFDYYFEKKGFSRRVDMVGGTSADIDAVQQAFVDNHPQYLWYLRGHESPDAGFIEFLNTDANLIEHQEYINADVWLFELNQAR